MEEDFNFQLNNRLLYGVGKSRELPIFLSDNGFVDVLVLVDEGVAAHSAYFLEIVDSISSTLRVSIIKLRGNEEPDYDYLDLISTEARNGTRPDVLIGIGGGSCLDMTKAVAVLLTNTGKGIDFRGFDKVEVQGVPTILIPTTAGTGSEVTINAVFTDKAENRKLGINGRHLNATWALLDAEWTVSCPQAAAISAGMDAVVHSLESFMCKQHNRLTRLLSKEAFRLLYENLPCLIEDPDNLGKRQELLLGAYLAGAALFNSGSGIAGAFSYPLGVHYKIPHGICGAIFIASVVEFNVGRGYSDYAELLDVVLPGSVESDDDKSNSFLTLLITLCDRMLVPRDLSAWGVGLAESGHIESLLINMQAAFDQNPVPFCAAEDAPALLRRHLL